MFLNFSFFRLGATCCCTSNLVLYRLYAFYPDADPSSDFQYVTSSFFLPVSFRQSRIRTKMLITRLKLRSFPILLRSSAGSGSRLMASIPTNSTNPVEDSIRGKVRTVPDLHTPLLVLSNGFLRVWWASC